MKPASCLIGCEFSGVVRRAFRDLGANAWSCDLLPAEDSSLFHLQGDVTGFLAKGWDFLCAHPPCTYLCNSGVRWLAPGGKLNAERHKLMQEACDFFAALYWAPIERVCVENPIMHKYARDYLESAWKIGRHYGHVPQIIQPWQHGHGERKATCLWLRGLPPLVPSRLVPGRVPRVHHASPGPDRWKVRSRTLSGVGAAMAAQWLPIIDLNRS